MRKRGSNARERWVKCVKELQAIAIQGFGGQRPIWTYMNSSMHCKYCFLAASQQCGLSRERHWKPLPRDQFIQGLRAAAMGRAGKTRVWLPPVTALAPTVLFTASATKGPAVNRSNIRPGDQPASEAQHWNAVTQRGWIAAVGRHGHFNSLGMSDCSILTFCLSHPYLVLMRSHSEVIKSAIDFMIASVCERAVTKSHQWASSLYNTCFRKRKDILSWKPLLIYSTANIVQWDKGCVIYPVT